MLTILCDYEVFWMLVGTECWRMNKVYIKASHGAVMYCVELVYKGDYYDYNSIQDIY